MIIMALDHSRDLLHISGATGDPTDLATTTPSLFFTRWVTHLCAPTFVFLSGVSAYLSFKKNGNVSASRNFLISRGLWLIILEFTVITFGLWADIKFGVFLFQVIGAIGFCFILLGLLIKVPAKILGIIGLVILFGHNLLALISVDEQSVAVKILAPLFADTAIPVTAGTLLIIAYPPIPWLGVMLAGFGLGYVFEFSAEKRKHIFLFLGTGSLLLFFVLRYSNIYGDQFHWEVQKQNLFTILSFVNVTKYPPSLLYCLATLGIMFLMLRFAEEIRGRVANVIKIYGQVPLFYYLIHWYILHSIMFIMLFLQGFKTSDFVFGFNFGRPNAPNGVELWALYLIWAAVVVLLYPICKLYSKYKQAHSENKLLRYL